MSEYFIQSNKYSLICNEYNIYSAIINKRQYLFELKLHLCMNYSQIQFNHDINSTLVFIRISEINVFLSTHDFIHANIYQVDDNFTPCFFL